MLRLEGPRSAVRRLCSSSVLCTAARFFSTEENSSSSESGSAEFHPPVLSDDVLPKAIQQKLRLAFIDAKMRHCSLCGEQFEVTAQSHANHIPHQGRMGIVERALSSHTPLGPRSLAPRTWKNLVQSKLESCRLPQLSGESVLERQRRMIYLLQFLVDRGVIKHSLCVYNRDGGQAISVHRSIMFETYEMIGDNVVKYLFGDRLSVMFPPQEGGLTSRLLLVQNLLDSNGGLRLIYDHLMLDRIIGCYLPNNKLKSDVVESLFGELQAYLWATETRCITDHYSIVYSPEQRYLRRVVEHTMHELGSIACQWAVEESLKRADQVLMECAAQMDRGTTLQKKYPEQSKHLLPLLTSVSVQNRADRPTNSAAVSTWSAWKSFLPAPASRTSAMIAQPPSCYRVIGSWKMYKDALTSAVATILDEKERSKPRRRFQLVGTTTERKQRAALEAEDRKRLSRCLLNDARCFVPVDWNEKVRTLSDRHQRSSAVVPFGFVLQQAPSSPPDRKSVV